MVMDRSKIILLSLFFLILLFITYSNHFHNGFEFDDGQAITNNVWVKDVKNIPLFFTDGKYSSTMATNQAYRPMVVVLDTIDYNMGAGDSFYFHLDIFSLYIVQLVLMFFVFRNLLDISFKHVWNNYIALFAVAYYGFHSSNAETINYIGSRSDSFSTLCTVAAFLLWQHKPSRNRYLYLLPAVLSIYTKETGVMFAPLLFVYVLLFEQEIEWTQVFQKANRKKIAIVFFKTLPAFIITFGVFFINMKFFTPQGTDSYNKTVTPITYFLSQLNVIKSQYLYNFLIPLKLNADPDDYPLLESIFDVRVLSALFVVLLMVFIAIYYIKEKKTRPISFGICWFFIALAPTSSFIARFQFANDHRVFFPYIGLILSVAWAVALFFIKHEQVFNTNKIIRYGSLSVITFIFCCYGYGAYKRNKIWASSELLWKDVTVKSPNNSRGLMNYGLSQMEKGEYGIAEDYFNRSLNISPKYSYLQINFGVLKAAMGQKEEAEKHFLAAIEYNSDNAEAYFFYARWLDKIGRKQEAKKQLETGRRISPGNYRIEQLLNKLNVESDNEGMSEVEIRTAILEKEKSPENYLELGRAYYNARDFNKCIEACQSAIALRPDYAEAYNNMCVAYNGLKEWEKAAEACKKALEYSPNFQLAKNNLKWAEEEIAKEK